MQGDKWASERSAPQEAQMFAEELGAIPRFPSWSKPATGAVAEVIAEICAGPREAALLVKAAIRTMTDWGGIPALRAVYAEQHDTHMEQSWKAPQCWDGGPPQCAVCGDTGAVQDNPADLFHSCSACAEGQSMSAGLHVAALNREMERARNARRCMARQRGLRPVNHDEIVKNILVLEGKAE